MKKAVSLLILLVLTAFLSIAEGVEMGNCPVMGGKIDPKTAVTYDYKGNTYTFCCADCIDSFKKDPEKYIAIAPPLSGTVKDGVREITVIARKYEFLPDPIGVKQGEKVRLKITATDTEHGLGIKEYNINRDLPAGKEQIVEFTADKAGTFTSKCTVFCGLGHSHMKGRLIVQEEKKAAAEKMPMMREHKH